MAALHFRPPAGASEPAEPYEPRPASNLGPEGEVQFAIATAELNDLEAAARNLAFMARTTGGTAGRDAKLCEACERVENILGISAEARALLAPAPVKSSATFEGYLTVAMVAGITDFRIRALRSPHGNLDFYIHPLGADGETGDFEVRGDLVSPIEGGYGAGSRRPPPEALVTFLRKLRDNDGECLGDHPEWLREIGELLGEPAA